MNSISTHRHSALFTELSPEAEQFISGGGLMGSAVKAVAKLAAAEALKVAAASAWEHTKAAASEAVKTATQVGGALANPARGGWR